MKVTDVKTFVVDCFRTNWVFVKVYTDEGITGVGEGTLEYKEKALVEERIKIVNYCRKHTIPYVGLVRDKDSFNLIECEGDCYLCQCRKTEKSLKEKSK